MTVILHLTDTDGDPVLVPFDKVTLIEEIRKNVDGGPRTFLRTKLWFMGGSPSYATVRESIPEILEQLSPKPQPPTPYWDDPLPSRSWLAEIQGSATGYA